MGVGKLKARDNHLCYSLRRSTYGRKHKKFVAKAHNWIYLTQLSVTNYRRKQNPSQISEEKNRCK